MPNPNEDNPIQKLWEYIPPYTAPNYPPQVEVITTTNTGDTPMTDPDIVTKLNREADQAASLLSNPNNTGKRMALIDGSLLREAADEIERLRKERDEARRMLCEEWAQQDGLPLDWQGRRGAEGMAEFVKWDCYKENKENTNG